MAQDKQSFILYCDLIHMVNKLSDEKAGKLFKHVLAYVNDQYPETDDPLIEIAFEPIKQSLKRDLRKYEKKCERNRENINKRWNKPNTVEDDPIPSNTNVLNRIPNDTTVYDRIRMNTKHTDSDSGTDSGTDTGIDPEKNISKKSSNLININSVLPEVHSPIERISNYSGLQELRKDNQFDIGILDPDGLAAIALDLFRIKYRELYSGEYPIGSWDRRTLLALIKENGFETIEKLIIEYFRIKTRHTVKEFSNHLSDGFKQLMKTTTTAAERMFQ